MLLETSSSAQEIIVINLGFAFCGGAIKYIDDAFDSSDHGKILAMIFAPITGVICYLLIATDIAAATILLAIMLGVALKGKIDTVGHLLALAIVLLLLYVNPPEIMLLPWLVLGLAGFADEIGNDFVDSRPNLLKRASFWSGTKFTYFFLEYRCFMKVMMIILFFMNILSWYYLVAFLFFDLAYHLTGVWSEQWMA